MAEIETYLNEAVIPMRLAVIAPSGWPTVLSLWFLYEGGVFKCASRGRAKVIDALSANPRCGFEIAGEAPPYFGIRGQGSAALGDDGAADLLIRLVDRYCGRVETPFRKWLLAGAEEEIAITIAPKRLMSWDYRTRMSRD